VVNLNLFNGAVSTKNKNGPKYDTCMALTKTRGIVQFRGLKDGKGKGRWLFHGSVRKPRTLFLVGKQTVTKILISFTQTLTYPSFLS